MPPISPREQHKRSSRPAPRGWGPGRRSVSTRGERAPPLAACRQLPAAGRASAAPPPAAAKPEKTPGGRRPGRGDGTPFPAVERSGAAGARGGGGVRVARVGRRRAAGSGGTRRNQSAFSGGASLPIPRTADCRPTSCPAAGRRERRGASAPCWRGGRGTGGGGQRREAEGRGRAEEGAGLTYSAPAGPSRASR